MMTIEHLSKKYGSKQVLHDVNLHLEKGKVYGIVGENGAGKTTLFRCIAGLEGHAGTIKSELEDLKSQLGFLPTNPFFLSKITGWEYLKLLCTARNITTDDFEDKNIFDLPLNQYAENYSTGMKKKLAFSGLLFQKNEVFILDEPFNGVDIQSNILIIQIILKLKSLGKTIILSSHIFSTLSDTCDEIHLMKEGSFIRKVEKENFDNLNEEMKNFVVGNKLEQLDL